jgi:NTP pyrophosphatase (non-canonical NTP hydrolase)
MDIKAVQKQLERFADERDWNQFHSPKNLAVSICIEAAELLELFQWDSEEAMTTMPTSPLEKRRQEDELADVMIYLLRLTDKLGIDLEGAVARKLEINAEKYPVSLAKGNAIKHSRRDSGEA